ncbi:MAG TPA: hypothetical protein VL752_02620 [Acidisoma sp.]|uniref:hypothetical protein n=1 Tax=Acidisoma sp. TaxID=1872115 RepID=UPI002BA43926|nr:hypothetical protein [Acidisoma sp.]HTH99816.1 hypothetical protein [Acidisoma sp.]
MVEPDFDQEGEIQRAEAMLAMQPASLPPLIAAAMGFRAWVEAGETRASMRAAMIRFWRKHHLLRLPVPLTGAASLRAEQSWDWELWAPAFLGPIEREAADGLDLLYALERAWFSARRAMAGRRKDAHDARAVDVLGAAPVLSATTLARVLGIALKNAIRILDTLVAAEIAVEVTHRSKRRLFALAGLAPLREVVRPPYRPEPGRGPGRQRYEIEHDAPEMAPSPLPPLTPVERRAFDYTALEEAMAHLDVVVRQARRNLGTSAEAGLGTAHEAATQQPLATFPKA